MNKVAIIAEYNPFHNGHVFQLQEAKKRFPNEKILIILSGKFVQRGEISLMPFKLKKEYALKHGADEVVELPFSYATQAAHVFAQGAVDTAILHGADKIFFGSESNDVTKMEQIAQIQKQNPQEYKISLRFFLKQGFSFPKSNALALKEISGTNFELPNDILGMEYIKHIVFNDLPIKAYSLKRTIDFHAEITIDNKFASASLIRQMIKNGDNVKQFSPVEFNFPIDYIENHYFEFQEIVRRMPKEELGMIKLISEGMENLFKKHVESADYETFVNTTNSKRYTSSRIKRVMLYVLLQIK
jgi:predicted nucleotidyltransferase